MITRSILLSLLLSVVTRPFPCHSFTVPAKVRLNRHGEPRLCSLVGAILKGVTRTALCFPSTTDEFSVAVTADSNRAVLRGNLNDVSIRVQDSRSKAFGGLSIGEFQVQASQLDLGYTPLLAVVSTIWLLLRPGLLWRILLGYFFWRFYGGYLQKTLLAKNSLQSFNRDYLQPSWQSFQKEAKRLLGGSFPCHANYSLTLTDDNLEQSGLLRRGSGSILEFLMRNSALQIAAAVGDTSMILRQQQQQRDNQKSISDNKEKSNIKNVSDGQLSVSPNRSDPLPPGSTPPEYNFQLTQLLSATSFELREAPTFTDDGHWLLPSRAVLPKSNDNSNTMSGVSGGLDFVLRTTIQPTSNTLEDLSALLPDWMNNGGNDRNSRQQNDNGIVFGSPECRFDVDIAATSRVIPGVLGKLLPSVLWIPVGPGVVLPLVSSIPLLGQQQIKHRVQRIDIVRGKCQLKGRLTFLWNDKNSIGIAMNKQGASPKAGLFPKLFPKPNTKALPPANKE